MRPLLLILLLLLWAMPKQVELPKLDEITYTDFKGVSMGKTPKMAAVLPIPYKDLKPGMWVRRALWDKNGKIVGYTGHRIVHREGPLWRMKGDNNQTNHEYDSIPLGPSSYAGVIADPITKEPL